MGIRGIIWEVGEVAGEAAGGSSWGKVREVSAEVACPFRGEEALSPFLEVVVGAFSGEACCQ